MVIGGSQAPYQQPEAQINKDGSVTLDPSLLQGHLIRVQSDNATTVAYINHQGGTRNPAAWKKASQIISLTETHCSAISADHILRKRKLESELPQLPEPVSRGMDPLPWPLQSDMSEIGNPGYGYSRLQIQQQTYLCVQDQGPSSDGIECLGISSGLSMPSPPVEILLHLI